MPRYYVDTSAYLALVLGQEGADELALVLEVGELLSSVLLVLEARRNLVRLSRDGLLSAAEYRQTIERLEADVECFALRELTLDLCSSPLVPAVATPRSLDLAHLRTAAWFHAEEPLTRFVSLDEHQLEAARELALPI